MTAQNRGRFRSDSSTFIVPNNDTHTCLTRAQPEKGITVDLKHTQFGRLPSRLVGKNFFMVRFISHLKLIRKIINPSHRISGCPTNKTMNNTISIVPKVSTTNDKEVKQIIVDCRTETHHNIRKIRGRNRLQHLLTKKHAPDINSQLTKPQNVRDGFTSSTTQKIVICNINSATGKASIFCTAIEFGCSLPVKTPWNNQGTDVPMSPNTNPSVTWELAAPWTRVQIKVPVKFIVGDLDLVYNIPGTKEYIHNGGFKKDVPLLQEVVVMEGVAHFLHQEKPEEVSEHIYDFINKF
ncbi:hypothetical protein QYF36_008791 [Acer negundo]|nr:hypothetical protein QYF36_008791 [Acer negundo]